MRRHCLLNRKDRTHESKSVGMPLERRRAVREAAEILSKPPLMSRKREDTLVLGRWYDLTSCTREAEASKVLSPAREPHWLVWRRPTVLARSERRVATMRSRIFETVSRRTIMRKDAGEE